MGAKSSVSFMELNDSILSTSKLGYQDIYGRPVPCLVALVVFVWICSYVFRVTRDRSTTCPENRLFKFEPSWFARVRWSVRAEKILKEGNKKAKGAAWKLARGDTDLLVLPPDVIPELNRLGTDVLDSRQSHDFTLLGHITGMQVVRETSFHVRVLLSRINPALPQLFLPTAKRVYAAIQQHFPRDHHWKEVQMLSATVSCLSEGIALALYGTKMSEDPRLKQLTLEHTQNVFKVAFAMRCFPAFLQPFFVWLLPAKWRLQRGWRELRRYVVPEVHRQRAGSTCEDLKDGTTTPSLIAWMVKDGRTELERDPHLLTTLAGSIAAGSTYSIGNFICQTLSDLAAHPEVLDAIRTEIRARCTQIGGCWDFAALRGLDNLESAMKETARLTPGTLIVYSRVVQRDHVLQNGTVLRKGQFVTISGPSRTQDESVFAHAERYDGLRFCADPKALEKHRALPFSSVDTDVLTWGSGRWACPGRHLADMTAKTFLVKLIDEYDIAFVDGVQPGRSAIHEFLFFHPENKMLMRRRDDAVGIEFINGNTVAV